MKTQKLSITIAAIITVGLLVGGCGGKAESSANTTNSEFTVEKLFEHEGCIVYRFSDAKTVHFVKCTGFTTTTTAETQNCGKNCNRTEETVTLTPPGDAGGTSDGFR